MQRYNARETQDMGSRCDDRRPRHEALALLHSEGERIADLKARAARPFGAGSEIVDMAPARGPVAQFQPREAVNRGGKTMTVRAGWRGQDALRRADAFDVMEAQAQRRAKVDGKLPKGYRPLFTTGQLVAARDYAALSERVSASGVKCSSIEAMGAGSGGQGSWIDAVLQDGAQLAAIKLRVGEVSVIAPKNAGGKRAIVWAQDLVDQVCIADQTMNDVLHRFGWSKSTKMRAMLLAGLCEALNRMQGFTR